MHRMPNYVVIFDSVTIKNPPPLSERLFETRHDANCYKHEHPQGKFATVMSTLGTATEGFLKK